MTSMGGKKTRRQDGIPLSVAQQIDENLKRLYVATASEPLPQTLTDLLDELRKQDAHTKSGDA